jgi:para-nitrobenzyl esterase
MKRIASFFLLFIISSIGFTQADHAAPRVKTSNGILEGVDLSGISVFRGIPFAAPPVGELRWKEPQRVKSWTGVRKATQFGPRPMQLPLFGDMNFRSDSMSEDCLYLNVWSPAKTGSERLPVLVYFYGGGYATGDGSEPRYDGESMARQGIVVVTVNYRVGVFGFFAHPELTQESPHHASGNQGLLDQSAAIRWVYENIAAFGGNPKKITIGGESAGSGSVSVQMASPLSKGLIAGAIGESSSLLGTTFNRPLTALLKDAEKAGSRFASDIKANTLAKLRAMPAEQVLKASEPYEGISTFWICVDGYFLTKAPEAIYEAGEQASVPLLVGWNSEEMGSRALLQQNEPTVENFTNAVKRIFGDRAAQVVEIYGATTNAAVKQAATDLASDLFTGYSSWKWGYLHSRKRPVYRYMYARPRPAMRPEMGNATTGLAGGVIRDSAASRAPNRPPAQGAVHAAEIEYALGNLPANKVFDWQPEDYKVSQMMQLFFVNFIKTGNPNGLGVPTWPALNAAKNAEVMHIDVNTRVRQAANDNRYFLLDGF